jgi:hypothetical protein
MRSASIFALGVSAGLVCGASAAAAAPVQFVCSGPKVDAARKLAAKQELKLAMDPKACFGEMNLYPPGTRKQLVVTVPSAKCPKGQLLDVYDQSRAGGWYSLFAAPVCGTSISVGPRSPYGDNLLTIDGRQYLDKAGAFVPFK